MDRSASHSTRTDILYTPLSYSYRYSRQPDNKKGFIPHYHTNYYIFYSCGIAQALKLTTSPPGPHKDYTYFNNGNPSPLLRPGQLRDPPGRRTAARRAFGVAAHPRARPAPCTSVALPVPADVTARGDAALTFPRTPCARQRERAQDRQRVGAGDRHPRDVACISH